MANYNRLERPVLNDSAAILVELGLTLLQIIDVVREGGMEEWRGGSNSCFYST